MRCRYLPSRTIPTVSRARVFDIPPRSGSQRWQALFEFHGLGSYLAGTEFPLIFLERDKDSHRKGYTAPSYIQTVKEGLLSKHHVAGHFQRDNAKVHTAKASMEWLLGHGIELGASPPIRPT